ncbi:hypothetical protein RJI07_04565 [Mycoplasmatota bacterium WC30]
MIYIISGTSRSGKSTAVNLLFNKINIPYLPTDTVMMGFHNGMPEIGVDPETYSYEIAKKIWPFLRSMIVCMIENEIDYIFEGEAFLVGDVRSLMDSYPGNVRACFMGYTDISLESKYKQIMKYSADNDWFIKNTEEYIKNHLSNMIELSKSIKIECTEHNIKYFDSSKDFEGTITEVVEYLR